MAPLPRFGAFDIRDDPDHYDATGQFAPTPDDESATTNADGDVNDVAAERRDTSPPGARDGHSRTAVSVAALLAAGALGGLLATGALRDEGARPTPTTAAPAPARSGARPAPTTPAVVAPPSAPDTRPARPAPHAPDPEPRSSARRTRAARPRPRPSRDTTQAPAAVPAPAPRPRVAGPPPTRRSVVVPPAAVGGDEEFVLGER